MPRVHARPAAPRLHRRARRADRGPLGAHGHGNAVGRLLHRQVNSGEVESCSGPEAGDALSFAAFGDLKEKFAPHGSQGQSPRRDAAGVAQRHWRRARARPRPPAHQPVRLESRDEARADRGRMGRPAIRLARRSAREVERDCLRCGGAHARRRRGPDVARGLVENRRLESGRSRPVSSRLDCSLRCVFPFPDGLIAAAQAGATAAVQPGGSMRDPDVIAAADAHNLAMVFTGVRHFKH